MLFSFFFKKKCCQSSTREDSRKCNVRPQTNINFIVHPRTAEIDLVKVITAEWLRTFATPGLSTISFCPFSCHLPLLYIGVEYGLTNSVKLAERFFSQALEIAPDDPFLLHELGVTCYQNQE